MSRQYMYNTGSRGTDVAPGYPCNIYVIEALEAKAQMRHQAVKTIYIYV